MVDSSTEFLPTHFMSLLRAKNLVWEIESRPPSVLQAFASDLSGKNQANPIYVPDTDATIYAYQKIKLILREFPSIGAYFCF